MHVHNYNKCITITDIRNFMHSYHGLISVLMLITGLCSYGTPVGVTELILKLRSLYLFGDTRRYHRDYRTYTGIAELILVLRILYWYYGTCTCLTDLILVLRNMYLSYGSYTELILVQKYP